ncbi:hypothetical protein [Streptomyces mirabilis]
MPADLRRELVHRVVGERLELEGVARRIEEEHRPLLTGPALEAHVRLDDELGARLAQAVGELPELGDRQDQAEVRQRDVVGRPSTGLWASRTRAGARCVTNWCPCRFQSTQVSALRLERGGVGATLPGR